MEEIVFIKKANGKDTDYRKEDEGEDWIKESAKFKLKGETFHACYWKAKGDEKPKSLVVVLHGYAEYLNFAYEEAARLLVKSCGAVVFGHDHLGHGRTTGTRVTVDSMDEYVDPIIAHVKFMKSQHADTLCFIVAHSMGGLIGLHTLFRDQELFQGIVLNGPFLAPDPDMATPFKVFMVKLMQGFWPSLPVGELDTSLVTRDAEVVKMIQEDGLCWKGGTKARLCWILLESQNYVKENAASLTLPVLVLQGEKDKIVSPSGSKMITDSIGSADKEYVGYPEAFHNLFIELEDVKKDVMKRMQNFINSHL